jgi:hypothetical protein
MFFLPIGVSLPVCGEAHAGAELSFHLRHHQRGVGAVKGGELAQDDWVF